jgi:outer membrane receptor for ferrienterochelin and colicin
MDSARRLWTSLVMSLLVLLGAASAYAQSSTTGSITGRVQATDASGVLPGVTVTAVHVPTGATYTVYTDEGGRYSIPNVRVGGPYTVNASLDGFQTTEVSGVTVNLGSATAVDIELPQAALAETIEVVAEAEQLINPNRTGAATQVSETQIATLPTVNRSLQDFARTNPYFTVDAGDAAATRVTVAGRNNRYNSIQIDGAVNNDVFGLADTGTPGGQADTQPISLEAVQEIQLVLSPYDVRQAGFTGGGINAITRSGSNEWHGAVFGTQRDESMVGEINGRKVSAFDSEQYGGRLGGPIVRDQAFFFVSGEMNSRENPSGVSADGNATTQFGNRPLAQRVGDVLRTTYGYDAGGLNEFVFETESDLLLAKIDWNAAPNHLLTFRHNYVDAFADRIESGSRPSTSVFSFDSHYYDFTSETNSTVLQLNSSFGSNLFNEARIGYQTVRDQRATTSPFPHVEVREAGTTIFAGINRFSHANALDQDILEITDDLTFLRGNHTITVGTHNEVFSFANLFIDSANGTYIFNTVDQLAAGTPSSYSIGFSTTGNNEVEFDAIQYGVYAGDQWRVNDSLTFSGGLRLDMPTFPDTPSRNPLMFSALGVDTSDVPERMMLWQPRLGFNWAPDTASQLRGGVGVFAGRTPYVWMSNNYQNSGVEFSLLTVTSNVPRFVPSQPPPAITATGAPELNAVDPDFEFPQVARATLAYDRELPWGIQATIEGVYSQALEDAYYTNENLVRSGTLPDGRPLYTRRDTRLGAVYMLRNTSEGDELNLSLQARKRFAMGLDIRANYRYAQADSLADLTSSRAVSNYRFSPQVDPFNPEVNTSIFEIEHRGMLAATYNFATGPVTHDLGLFFNVQSGAPVTYIFNSDVNSDFHGSSQNGNDPIYVPAGPNDVILAGGLTWDQVDAFLRSDDCLNSQRGQIYDRNSCSSPYVRQLDLHYGLGFDIAGTEIEVTADVLNLMNLIDEDEGLYYTTPFNAYNVFRATVDPATNKYRYEPGFTNAVRPGAQYSLHNDRSRWQARLGLKVSF